MFCGEGAQIHTPLSSPTHTHRYALKNSPPYASSSLFLSFYYVLFYSISFILFYVLCGDRPQRHAPLRADHSFIIIFSLLCVTPLQSHHYFHSTLFVMRRQISATLRPICMRFENDTYESENEIHMRSQTSARLRMTTRCSCNSFSTAPHCAPDNNSEKSVA